MYQYNKISLPENKQLTSRDKRMNNLFWEFFHRLFELPHLTVLQIYYPAMFVLNSSIDFRGKEMHKAKCKFDIIKECSNNPDVEYDEEKSKEYCRQEDISYIKGIFPGEEWVNFVKEKFNLYEFNETRYQRIDSFCTGYIELKSIEIKVKSEEISAASDDNEKQNTVQDEVEESEDEISVEERANSQNEAESIESHFFYIPGNCESTMRYIKNAITDIEKGKVHGLNITAHLIDPRGVGVNDDKMGKTGHLTIIINDYVAIIKKKIDDLGGAEHAYKCVISGYSLGGGFAAQVRSRLSLMGYEVQLDLNKTFDSLVGAVRKTPILKSLKPLGDVATGFFGMQLNSKKCTKDIRPEHITYTGIKNDSISSYCYYGKSLIENRKIAIQKLINELNVISTEEVKKNLKEHKFDKHDSLEKFTEWLEKCKEIYEPGNNGNVQSILKDIEFYELSGGKAFEAKEEESDHNTSYEKLKIKNNGLENGWFEFRLESISRKIKYRHKKHQEKEQDENSGIQIETDESGNESLQQQNSQVKKFDRKAYGLGIFAGQLIGLALFGIFACMKKSVTEKIAKKSVELHNKHTFWEKAQDGFLNGVINVNPGLVWMYEAHKIRLRREFGISG